MSRRPRRLKTLMRSANGVLPARTRAHKPLQRGRNVAAVRPNGPVESPRYLVSDRRRPTLALRRLRLAQRRKALGHSQDDLAALVGVDRSTVTRWEPAETEPQPWLRRKLANHLRIRPEELSELLEAVSEVPSREDGYTLLSSAPLDFSLIPGHTVQVMEGFSAHDLASRRQVLERLSILSSAALLTPIRQWVPRCRCGPSASGPLAQKSWTNSRPRSRSSAAGMPRVLAG